MKQPDGHYNNSSKNKEKRLGIMDTLILGTWNVRGLNNKETELERELKARNVNIAVISETKKKGRGTKDLYDYSLIYSGVDTSKRACSGVALLIDSKWKNKLLHYTYHSDRILEARFRIPRGHLTVLAVYAPEEGRTEDTDAFYETLQRSLDKCNKNDYITIAGDLNARVGKPIIPKKLSIEIGKTLENLLLVTTSK